jgi:hypothetical protein
MGPVFVVHEAPESTEVLPLLPPLLFPPLPELLPEPLPELLPELLPVLLPLPFPELLPELLPLLLPELLPELPDGVPPKPVFSLEEPQAAIPIAAMAQVTVATARRRQRMPQCLRHAGACHQREGRLTTHSSRRSGGFQCKLTVFTTMWELPQYALSKTR